jgi:hypothetical protein
MVKPIAGSGGTTRSGAVDMITAIALRVDIDHPAIDYPVAEDADAPIIKRVPFSEGVCFAEGEQFFGEREVFIHFFRIKHPEKISFSGIPQSGRRTRVS